MCKSSPVIYEKKSYQKIKENSWWFSIFKKVQNMLMILFLIKKK